MTDQQKAKYEAVNLAATKERAEGISDPEEWKILLHNAPSDLMLAEALHRVLYLETKLGAIQKIAADNSYKNY